MRGQLEKHEGIYATVIQIVASEATSLSTRLAAAVYLKNRVARSWSSSSSKNSTSDAVDSSSITNGATLLSSSASAAPPSSSSANTNQPKILESDRLALKQNLLPVLIAVQQRSIKVQLKTCLSTIISEDFPEKWPGLLESVLQLVQSGQQEHIEGGLLALVEILKCYR